MRVADTLGNLAGTSFANEQRWGYLYQTTHAMIFQVRVVLWQASGRRWQSQAGPPVVRQAL